MTTFLLFHYRTVQLPQDDLGTRCTLSNWRPPPLVRVTRPRGEWLVEKGKVTKPSGQVRLHFHSLLAHIQSQSCVSPQPRRCSATLSPCRVGDRLIRRLASMLVMSGQHRPDLGDTKLQGTWWLDLQRYLVYSYLWKAAICWPPRGLFLYEIWFNLQICVYNSCRAVRSSEDVEKHTHKAWWGMPIKRS